MAQRLTRVLDDDLDGGPAAETVAFDLDGTAYAIDLSQANAAVFRAALAPFIRAASVTLRSSTASGRQRTAAERREDNTAIRAWARDAGYPVRDLGRLKKTVVDAYYHAIADR